MCWYVSHYLLYRVQRDLPNHPKPTRWSSWAVLVNKYHAVCLRPQALRQKISSQRAHARLSFGRQWCPVWHGHIATLRPASGVDMSCGHCSFKKCLVTWGWLAGAPDRQAAWLFQKEHSELLNFSCWRLHVQKEARDNSCVSLGAVDSCEWRL